MEQKLHELKARLQEIFDLERANAILYWDQATYMPNGGAAARARQSALLGRLAHERATDPRLGELLDELADQASGESDDAALIRVARYDYDRETKIPSELVTEMYGHMAQSYTAWAEARPANDFSRMLPLLEKTLDLSRRYAECFGPYDHIADPLIHVADYGMKTADIRTLFEKLRRELVPLVQQVTAEEPADNSCLHQYFPEQQQVELGLQVIGDMGYDFTRGRQDKTLHPFMTKFGLGDVRITTRFNEHDFGDGLFSTVHEAGHAMYEQGITMRYDGSPLASGTSAGVHESQSRLWENIVGRSHGFWQHYYPKAQQLFPEQLGAVSLDTFYKAINRVQRSLIRVDADELTYNLHVMIRFGLELDLLEGKLAVRDLPEAWHQRYQEDLGVRAPDDRDGVLQDVHWYAGFIGGAFQGYTIGNILSAQFYEAALKAHPEIPQQIRQGEFGSLRGWMTEHIYQHGRKYTAPELVKRASGQDLSIEPYMRYLREKYSA